MISIATLVFKQMKAMTEPVFQEMGLIFLMMTKQKNQVDCHRSGYHEICVEVLEVAEVIGNEDDLKSEDACLLKNESNERVNLSINESDFVKKKTKKL